MASWSSAKVYWTMASYLSVEKTSQVWKSVPSTRWALDLSVRRLRFKRDGQLKTVGLTVFSFPEASRQRLRTSNMCETLNSQIKRSTRVVGLFPNESSLLRLVTGILIEISEEWEIGKIYLQPATKKQQLN
jgi:transposase-like protein